MFVNQPAFNKLDLKEDRGTEFIGIQKDYWNPILNCYLILSYQE